MKPEGDENQLKPTTMDPAGTNSIPVGPTTSDYNLRDGSVMGQDANLKVENPEGSNPKFVENIATLPYTEYADLPLIMQESTTNTLFAPQPSQNNAATMLQTRIDGSRDYMRTNKRRNVTARPEEVIRGTDVIIPFGSPTFRALTAENTQTTLSDTVAAGMEALSGAIRGKGVYREVENWKATQDQKNTVINYFNRSIPFTDLSTQDRFAFLMGYTRDLGILTLPFLAFSNNLGRYKFYKSHRMQYQSQELDNMYDPKVLDLLNQLYATIAEFPVVDDVFFERLNYLGTLHTSSKCSGMWGVIIRSDVVIDALPGLQSLQAKSSGYTLTTAKWSEQSWGNVIPSSLRDWEVYLLTGDRNAVYQTLGNMLEIAQSMKSCYAMLLGFLMQMEGKGAVKYTRLQEYLPVSGIDVLHPNFIANVPVFDYAYKERFEYAPRTTPAESGSTNVQVQINLCNLQSYNNTGYSSNLTMMRPIGPYHQEAAWKMDEIVDIGVYKGADSDRTIGVVQFTTLLGGNNGGQTYTSLNTDVISSSLAYASNNYKWVDAYFGDIHESVSVGANTAYQLSVGDKFFFYGYLNAYTSFPSRVPTVVADSAIADATTAEIAALQSWMAYIAEQADITNILWVQQKVTGATEFLLITDSGYRQTIWDEWDITLLGNVLHTSAAKLALKLTKKNVKDQVKGDYVPKT